MIIKLSSGLITRSVPFYWLLSEVAFIALDVAFWRGARRQRGTADSIRKPGKSAGGDCLPGALICGDSAGDLEDGLSAHAVGLDLDQSWRLRRLRV